MGFENPNQNNPPPQESGYPQMEPLAEMIDTASEELGLLWNSIPKDLKESPLFFELAKGYKGDVNKYIADQREFYKKQGVDADWGDFQIKENLERLRDQVDGKLGADKSKILIAEEKARRQEEAGRVENVGGITQEIIAESEKILVRPEDKNEKGQLLVFPGGPVSNLPEKQWKIARTEGFKQWFGDWENSPVKSFETAKGSIYTYGADGKTTRFKTAENKEYKKQDLTVFVELSEKENTEVLIGINDYKVYVVESQADRSVKKIRDNEDITSPDNIFLGVYKENGELLFSKKVSQHPINGYCPFDTRQFKKGGKIFTERHLGNKVVEIKYDELKLSKALDENGEPLLLGNTDGTVSFVKMKNPFDTNAKYIKNWMGQNKLATDPRRFDKFMNYLKSQGYDGLMVDGRPARDSATGKYGCDESQILRIEK
jgi:hypothetical protein